MTVIHSSDWLKGGEDVCLLFIESGISMSCLNVISWIFIMVKLIITLAITPLSIIFIYGKEGLYLPGGPIVISVIAAFVIAHIFCSVCYTIIITIFISALEDWKLHGQNSNDYRVVELFASTELKRAIYQLRVVDPAVGKRASLRARERELENILAFKCLKNL